METNEKLYVTYAKALAAVLALLAILLGWLFTIIVSEIRANRTEIDHLQKRITIVEVKIEKDEIR